MKIDWKLTLCLTSLNVLMSPLAQAQFCGLTNASLTGAYGYVASEAGTVATPPPETGTATGTTAPDSYSTTNLGELLGGIAAGNQLALGGVLTLDGAGDVNATETAGTIAIHVGTYSVATDCSVVFSLGDPFGTNAAITQLAGVVLGRGAEIDLTVPASLGSKTTATGTASTSGSGLAIKLVRVLYQNGCSLSNLTGLYGFVLNPTSIQTEASSSTGTTTSGPATVLGYLEFDGVGHIVALSSMSAASTVATASPYTALQYTGTYSVNSDCSGTMEIGNSTTAAASSGTGTLLNFVITPPMAPGGGAFAPAPGLDLSFSTAAASGSGYALAQ
jgi:hypothetical protein